MTEVIESVATDTEATETDVIDAEAGVIAGGPLDAARRARPNARIHSQAAFDALFAVESPGTFTFVERLVVAEFVVGIGSVPIDRYGDLLDEHAPELVAALQAAAASALADGPFGHYPSGPLSAEDTDGLRWTPSHDDVAAFGPRLAAGLAHAHLLVFRPREASPAALEALQGAGWSVDEIVTLSQLVTFLSYQLRVIHALRVLEGTADAAPGAGRTPVVASADASPRDTDSPSVPPKFTQEQLWWEPWLPPIEKDALTPEHYHGLVEAPRAALPYFRLLVRDPALLRARTLADLDIFTNENGGLPRAERELAAAAASRLNGCLFCASVHARAAARLSGREHDVQRLLDEGVTVSVDDRWDAIISTAVDLTRTPVAFGRAHITRLRDAGLGDQAIVDLIGAAAFFNWANRLMLSIGEPRLDAGKLEVIREYEGSKGR